MLNSVRTWNGNPNGPLLKYALGLRCSYRVLQRIVPKVRDVFAEIPYTRFSYAINRHARYLVFFFLLINPIHKRAIHELETRGEPGINPFFFSFFFLRLRRKAIFLVYFSNQKEERKRDSTNNRCPRLPSPPVFTMHVLRTPPIPFPVSSKRKILLSRASWFKEPVSGGFLLPLWTR